MKFLGATLKFSGRASLHFVILIGTLAFAALKFIIPFILQLKAIKIFLPVFALAGIGVAYQQFFMSLADDYNPDFNASSICSIYESNPEWKGILSEAKDKWKVEPHVVMAVIQQESNFKHDARPHVNGRLLSSAYGFSQALDGTWKVYQDETNRHLDRRDDFSDSVNFIGWYMNKSNKRLKIKMNSAEHQYLAYHEGWSGYKRKKHYKKRWLLKVAKKVEKRSGVYKRQMKKC